VRTAIGSTRAPSLRAFSCFFISLITIVALLMGAAQEVDAKKRKARSKANPKYAAYVIDAKTGKVLFSRNANARRYPASLTKMMTLYLVFEDLQSKHISLKSRLVMTKAGSRREPSKLGLKPGQSISMEQAIYSLVTKSANDVATAIGDKLAGSEKNFAKRMTLKSRQLGMKNTTFKNANGLTERGQTTTAADMAKLGLALREHFPRRYKYFQTRVFRYGKRRYSNHNRLLGKVRGVDGIKTGYTRASGFNLVSSASVDNRRIVAVVLGGRSGKSRNAHMTKLIRTHLPKASRGKAKKLVPSHRPSRPNSPGSTKTKTTSDVANGLKSLPSATTPMPQLRQTLTDKPDASLRLSIDQTKTASITPKRSLSGWQIQITASDNRDKALTMLKKAKAQNGKLLAAKAPVTQMIVKNGSRLYRGRFIGFSSQASARRACKVLKKKKYACIALSG
jgi:D-alanyl-D-alanine carboxypeptidase